jgi:endogenous inhibitor of DNA gyrase (YacG/DUF329 family)
LTSTFDIIEEEMDVLSLNDFSDFLLEEEGYRHEAISYGENKKASFRYYFLLRAIIADQDTIAHKIFADLGGQSGDFINSQIAITKSIIEQILQVDNTVIQRLRFKVQELKKERKQKTSELEVINGIIERDFSKDDKTGDDITGQLANIREKRDALLTAKVETLSTLKDDQNQAILNKISELEGQNSQLNDEIRNAKLQKTDAKNALARFEQEISNIRKMIAAKHIFSTIPVEQCPICLSDMPTKETNDKLCPLCNSQLETINLEKHLRYKKMIQEAIAESKQLIDLSDDIVSKKTSALTETNNKLNDIRKQYFDSITPNQQPTQKILNAISTEISGLSAEEQRLLNYLNLSDQRTKLNEETGLMTGKISNAQEQLLTLETSIAGSKEQTLSTWKKLFVDILSEAFGDVSSVDIDENYMPIVDGKPVRRLSSASEKVVSRLAYIYSLFLLKTNASINHPGFIFFDSPRDKDLDSKKYAKIVNMICQSNQSQVILTGSISDKSLYDQSKIILELQPNSKLLKPTVE